MKRLKLFIVLFFTALIFPMGYFILQTYQGLEREETARLRFFAETIFEEMENELLNIVHTEEFRPVDQYNSSQVPGSRRQGEGSQVISPLSELPQRDFILGYFQNNPDGSFHTPLTTGESSIETETALVISELKTVNSTFNPMRSKAAAGVRPPAVRTSKVKEAKAKTEFEAPYLDLSKKKSKFIPSSRSQGRVEEITQDQVLRLSQQSAPDASPGKSAEDGVHMSDVMDYETDMPEAVGGGLYETPAEYAAEAPSPARTFQVEIAPLQSVIISEEMVFLFRRVVIGEAIYRQGFVIKLKALASHLAKTHFSQHPISRYAGLRVNITRHNEITGIDEFGSAVKQPVFTHSRMFSFPFDFLSVNLACSRIPHSESRRTLSFMMLIFTVVFFLGFAAIYLSARTVIDLSERRSRFVASVTHELKTPLTNIRMYIEMLEQGIAGNPEREQEYFRVLNTESTRLSQLINNVLELSRLENRKRKISLQEGDLEDVFKEVAAVMGETIRQAGFSFEVENRDVPTFAFDAQIITLILINLIENSLKFGRTQPRKSIKIQAWRDGPMVNIAVVDTGPGIPKKAVKKIFQDFYRVEDALTRETSGTGIGLALVKKFVLLLNGTVSASNNTGPGCTITITLPA